MTYLKQALAWLSEQPVNLIWMMVLGFCIVFWITILSMFI